MAKIKYNDKTKNNKKKGHIVYPKSVQWNICICMIGQYAWIFSYLFVQ